MYTLITLDAPKMNDNIIGFIDIFNHIHKKIERFNLLGMTFDKELELRNSLREAVSSIKLIDLNLSKEIKITQNTYLYQVSSLANKDYIINSTLAAIGATGLDLDFTFGRTKYKPIESGLYYFGSAKRESFDRLDEEFFEKVMQDLLIKAKIIHVTNSGNLKKIDPLLNKIIGVAIKKTKAIYNQINQVEYGHSLENIFKYIEANKLERLFFENPKSLEWLDDGDEEYVRERTLDDQGNELLLFRDGSLGVKGSNGDSEAIHPLETKKFVNILMMKHLNFLFRKNNNIRKDMISDFGDDKYGIYNSSNYTKLISLHKTITNYDSLLKAYSINVLDDYNTYKISDNSIERNLSVDIIENNIIKVAKTVRSKNKFKSFLSKKYHHLITIETINTFNKINDLNIEREIFEDGLFKSIAAFQIEKGDDQEKINTKVSAFTSAFKRFANKVIYNFDKDFYKEIINNKSLNVQIITEDVSTMLLRIDDAAASIELGNDTWCISREQSSESSFSDYNKIGFQQYFYYDFNEENNKNNLIGITVNGKGEVTDAFDNKNISVINTEIVDSIVLNIKDNDELFNKPKQKKLSKGVS